MSVAGSSSNAISPQGERLVRNVSLVSSLRPFTIARLGSRLVTLFEGHTSPLWFASFSDDGTTAFSVGERTVRVWGPASGEQLTVVGGGVRPSGGAISSDGTRVLRVDATRASRVIDVRSEAVSEVGQQTVGQPAPPTTGLYTVLDPRESADGTVTAVALNNIELEVTNERTGVSATFGAFPLEDVIDARFVPGSDRLVIATRTRLMLIDTNDLTAERTRSTVGQAGFQLTPTSDGKRVATTADHLGSPLIEVFEADTLDTVFRLEGPTPTPFSISTSAPTILDCQWIAGRLGPGVVHG